MKRLKQITDGIIILLYIFLIGCMFIENGYFHFNSYIFRYLYIFLLGIGFYYFVNNID